MTRLDWIYIGVLGLLVLAYFGGDNSVFQEIEIVVLGCLFTLIYIALQVRLRMPGRRSTEPRKPEPE
jgi:hypothetical protein